MSFSTVQDSLQGVLTMNLNANTAKYNEAEQAFSLATFVAVLIAIFLSVVCIIIRSIYRKGSGQTEVPVPTDSAFRQSAFTEGWQAFTERIDTNLRNRIVAYEKNTPKAELSQRINTVYDRTDLRELVVKLKIEQLDDEQKTIQIAVPELSKAKRRIGFHSSKDKAGLSVESEKKAITNAIVSNEAETKKHWSEKQCENCGSSYKAKVAWQRFCKEDCKFEWHSKQHGGKTFDARKFRGKK
ncbi:MAG: hypothetical protein AAF738_00985 [Bacteroidota bacterium]